MAAKDVQLEGGELDGRWVELASMEREALGKFVLRVAGGVYRHDEETLADFRGDQRVAVFEPTVTN